MMVLTLLLALMMMKSCVSSSQESGVYSQLEREPIVRPATQANRFYEGNPQRLSREVDSLLNLHHSGSQDGRVAALIVPHAGYYFSGSVAASAYAQLRPQKPLRSPFMSAMKQGTPA